LNKHVRRASLFTYLLQSFNEIRKRALFILLHFGRILMGIQFIKTHEALL